MSKQKERSQLRERSLREVQQCVMDDIISQGLNCVNHYTSQ